MENLKSIIFVIAIVVNLQFNIVAMDSSSKRVPAYPAWTMQERDSVLGGMIERRRAIKSISSHDTTVQPSTGSRKTVYFVDYQQQEQKNVTIADFTPQQIQQKRAQIIANLTQKNISTLKASTIIECEAYKKLKQESWMSEQEFLKMTKELLHGLPDLLIRDDL